MKERTSAKDRETPLAEEFEQALTGQDRQEKLLAVEASGILRDAALADRLVDLLGSPDEELVETVLLALGRIGQPKSLKYLLPFLTGGNLKLAERAIEALGCFDPRQILDQVLKAAGPDRPPLLRRRLLMLVAGLKDPRVASAMNEVLGQTQDPGLLQEALGWFVRFPQPDRHSVLKALANHGQWEVAMTANLALSRLGDEAARSHLKRLLKSPAPPVRLAIVQGLSRCPMIQDRDLYEALLRDVNPFIRVAALDGLQLFTSAERFTLLADLIAREKDDGVRMRILERASREKAVPLMKEFLRLLTSAQEEQREMARHALVEMGAPVMEPLLREFAAAPVVLREQLAVVLGEIGDKRAVRALEGCLDAKERWLKLNSIEALARIAGPQYSQRFAEMIGREKDPWIIATLLMGLARSGERARLPLFIDHLNHADGRVRANAVEGAAMLGGAEVKAKLEEHLRDPNDRVRVNAAIALWKVGEASVLETLLELAKDRSKWVRASAAFALGEIGDKRATPRLLVMLTDREEIVHRNAIDALLKLRDERGLVPLLREKIAGTLPEEFCTRILAGFLKAPGGS